ncbi:MAG: tRNA uridine(34) 5-carboxymethylaminomethyl modification radical SAM/GNAT enzyme Elp3 [Candidatus Helarchaeota archaeon]
MSNSLSSADKNTLEFKKSCREIINELLQVSDFKKIKDINRIKLKIIKKYNNVPIPKNSDILFYATQEEFEKLVDFLKIKKVRSISGIVVVAIMSEPYPCPHGKCLYCPGGPNSHFNSPQSYTGFEPATRRGIQNSFDPYKQVSKRLEQLKGIGHDTSKIELIIMGGTFPARSFEYQADFIKNSLAAIVDFESNKKLDLKNETLENVILRCENSKHRLVGFTVETRPDFCDKNRINFLLNSGVTRVELGVQTIYNEIYKLVERGHTIEDVITATQLLKDSGFKVLYHIMPNLPGSNLEMDLDIFKTIYSDPRFKPDLLKVYPCLVIKGTKLYDLWKQGKYKPYPLDDTINLLSSAFSQIPPWIRIQRVQRDIPVEYIEAGVKKSNLRELVHQNLKNNGLRCNCIRCREVGLVELKENRIPDSKNIKLIKTVYEASNGIEIFLSYEDIVKHILIGYLRLRIPSEKAFRPEITEKNSAIVRALHIYGSVVPIDNKFYPYLSNWQHKKFGTKLLETAESIAKNDFDIKKILIISGIGVREYYFKFGYKKDGPYVSKNLN